MHAPQHQPATRDDIGLVIRALRTHADLAEFNGVLKRIPKHLLDPDATPLTDAPANPVAPGRLWAVARSIADDPETASCLATLDLLLSGVVRHLAQDRLSSARLAEAVPVIEALTARTRNPELEVVLIRALDACGQPKRAHDRLKVALAGGLLHTSKLVSPAPTADTPSEISPGSLALPAYERSAQRIVTKPVAQKPHPRHTTILDGAMVLDLAWIAPGPGQALMEGLSFRDTTRLHDRAYLRSGDGKLLLHPPLNWDTTPLVPGRTLFLGKTLEHGHFILEGLERLAAFADGGIPAHDRILVQELPRPGYLELLGELGLSVDPAHYFKLGSSPTRFERLILPGSTTSMPSVDGDRIRTLRTLGLSAIEQSDPRSPRRIYMARKPQRRRHLANEAEISDLLAEHGFETVYPEDVPFIDQLAMLRDTEMVLGVHGSALFNLIWGRAGTEVGLIVPHDWPDWGSEHVEMLAAALMAAGMKPSALLAEPRPAPKSKAHVESFNAALAVSADTIGAWIENARLPG